MGSPFPYPPPPPPAFNPWAPPPSGPAQQGRTITARLVVLVVAAMAASVVGGYALGASDDPPAQSASPATRPAPAPTTGQAPVPSAPPVGITAHSPLTASSGSMFFTDSFHDASQGWDTGSDKDVTTRIVSAGYQTTLRRNWVETIPSPYQRGVWQLGQKVTARLSKGFGSDSALGLSCERDFDKSNDLAYQFIVDSTGTWTVYRLNKANLSSSRPHLLARGPTTAAGLKAITVGVDCVTLSDHRTNRLVLFVNGVKEADLTNVAPLADEGWGGEMFNAGDYEATTVVTASLYTESTLDTNVAVGTST